MNLERDAELAAIVLDIRTPLSRVELAASRLAREDMPPRARDLAETIREAVAAIDRELENAVLALAPRAERTRSGAGPVLEALRTRLAPVLEARGLELEIEPAPEVELDPTVLRRAAIALTRAAVEHAGPGAFRLGLRPSQHGWGVSVYWRGRADPAAAPVAPFREAQRLAMACGGWIERSDESATFWLDGGPRT